MSSQEYAAVSDQGRMRDHNEDRWCAHEDLGLFVVSDGMGGGPVGELASQIVTQALPAIIAERFEADIRSPEAKRLLCAALEHVSAQMLDSGREQLWMSGMGATAVVALIRDGFALIAHIGDSRAYLLRDGRLRRLTRDHSVAQILLDAREITAAQATRHPGRAQLTRHVGMDGEVLPDASCHGIRRGDRLLLCTDGLTGPLRDAHMERILEQHPDPASASRALVDAAQQAGGGDDVTALVLAN